MKINIKGDIVPNDYKWIYDFLGWESCCPNDVHTAIKNAADGEALDVEINSLGGHIFAGSEIYTALQSYAKGAVNVVISGLAASAASVIAMAGKVIMSPTALMMVHNVSGNCQGDYRDMTKTADTLKTANESIAAAYVNKSGMEMAKALKMMDDETWLTANKAKEYGLIDDIAYGAIATPLLNSFGMISTEALDKLKNIIPNKKLTASAELELLKITGVKL